MCDKAAFFFQDVRNQIILILIAEFPEESPGAQCRSAKERFITRSDAQAVFGLRLVEPIGKGIRSDPKEQQKRGNRKGFPTVDGEKHAEYDGEPRRRF